MVHLSQRLFLQEIRFISLSYNIIIELWRSITEEAKQYGFLASSFALCCVKHGYISKVSKPEDFIEKAPIGKLYIKGTLLAVINISNLMLLSLLLCNKSND